MELFSAAEAAAQRAVMFPQTEIVRRWRAGGIPEPAIDDMYLRNWGGLGYAQQTEESFAKATMGLLPPDHISGCHFWKERIPEERTANEITWAYILEVHARTTGRTPESFARCIRNAWGVVVDPAWTQRP